MICLNRKVVVGAAAAAIIVFVTAPNLVGPLLPIVVMAACPLSMLVMGRSMTRRSASPEASPVPDADRAGEVQQLRDEVGALRAQLGAPTPSGMD